ncbi:hypothetical protein GCM10023317_53710 [Actinopolymorpha pittospori]
MNLFGFVRDKAAELIQTAKEQVGAVAGIELPTEPLADRAESTAADAAQSLTQTGQDLTTAAEGAINDGADKLTGTEAPPPGDSQAPLDHRRTPSTYVAR